MSPQRGVRIPFEELSPETLRNVVEEFVTRDGTDLVDADKKVGEVLALLRRGDVELWFDEETGTCNVLGK